MRLRILAALTVALTLAGAAPAQWTFTDVGGPVVYPPYNPALVTLPDGNTGFSLVTSPSGTFVAGKVRFQDTAGIPFTEFFRWNLVSGRVEYLDAEESGLVYLQDVLAIADNGSAVVEGLEATGFVPFTAAFWRAGTLTTTHLTCMFGDSFGEAGKSWALRGCTYLQVVGGTPAAPLYEARCTGYQAGVYQTANVVVQGPGF
jgi:hypothetical protein